MACSGNYVCRGYGTTTHRYICSNHSEFRPNATPPAGLDTKLVAGSDLLLKQQLNIIIDALLTELTTRKKHSQYTNMTLPVIASSKIPEDVKQSDNTVTRTVATYDLIEKINNAVRDMILAENTKGNSYGTSKKCNRTYSNVLGVKYTSTTEEDGALALAKFVNVLKNYMYQKGAVISTTKTTVLQDCICYADVNYTWTTTHCSCHSGYCSHY